MFWVCLFMKIKKYLRSQYGVQLQCEVVIANPWWFVFPASPCALIGGGQRRVPPQLSCGAAGEVEML